MVWIGCKTETVLKNLHERVKEMIEQENKGRERNYVACVIHVSDSLILKQNSVLLLLCTALCFMVVGQNFEESRISRIEKFASS